VLHAYDQRSAVYTYCPVYSKQMRLRTACDDLDALKVLQQSWSMSSVATQSGGESSTPFLFDITNASRKQGSVCTPLLSTAESPPCRARSRKMHCQSALEARRTAWKHCSTSTPPQPHAFATARLCRPARGPSPHHLVFGRGPAVRCHAQGAHAPEKAAEGLGRTSNGSSNGRWDGA